MSKKLTKSICVPIDGSDNAKRSLDYLYYIYGSTHPLEVTLLYILPTLPPFLVEEQKKNSSVARKLKDVEAKNIEVAERYLSEAKTHLIEKGFDSGLIRTVHREKVETVK